MNSEVKIYKIDLQEASKQMQMLLESFSFSNLAVTHLKTDIWADYLILTISLQEVEG